MALLPLFRSWFGAEFEYTRAAYGTINTKGDVVNTDPVGNFRVLLTLFYYFEGPPQVSEKIR